MDSKKEPGNFADKKREEKGRGVIVAGPDAHENEKSGKAPSERPKILSRQTGFVFGQAIGQHIPLRAECRGE